MSNSSLISCTNISPNKTTGRTHAIDTITIHCTAGQVTASQLGNMFSNYSYGASSNYGIGYDGKIGMYVEEKDRSWCSSNGANDNRAITIEVSSENVDPYKVTDKAYNALIMLLVDICQRNGIKELLWKGDKSLIGQVDKQNMTVHRWFANKACPGDYLYNKHSEIAASVNKRLNAATNKESTTTTTTTSTVTETTTKTTTESTTSTSTTTDVNYVVKVTVKNLRIREKPTTISVSKGYIKPGSYTIVQESTGNGATKWGKLKSGAGWISLDYCTKK